jgi:hypothetical protein
VTVSPLTGLTTTEGHTQATFTVVLHSEPIDDVVIGLTSTDVSEARLDLHTLTFTDYNWNVTQTVTVTGQNDFVDDGDIAFKVISANATSATDSKYNGLRVGDVSSNSNTDGKPVIWF